MKVLQRLSAQVIYTEYPNIGHDSWTSTYSTMELYPWFLQHTLADDFQ